MSEVDRQSAPSGLEFERPPEPAKSRWHHRIAKSLKPGREAVLLPDGVRVYAVGDIHGRSDLLAAAHALIRRDAASTEQRKYLVYVGDYVDRGPDSRGVIEQLLRGMPGYRTLYLRGNHDEAVLTFLSDPAFYRVWRGFGGQETLLSYGVKPPKFEDMQCMAKARDEFAAALPAPHRQFLENLPFFARIGGYFFVHAGVRPGVPFEFQAKEDMLWIRDEFLESDLDFGAVVVHGHTPTQRQVVRKNRIGIDTGAYATGNLTVAVLEGRECRFLAAAASAELETAGFNI